jgi:hypothetical protein
MYLQKVILKKKTRKKFIFVGVLKITHKKAGSGAGSFSQRWGSRSISKSHGSRTPLLYLFLPSRISPLYSNAMHPTLLEMLLK